MRKFRVCFSATATLALCLASGCTSPNTRAANKAAEAQVDLDQDRITAASIAITKALAARDDIVDYWLLKAHIDLRAGDRIAAFGDYEYVHQLDHGNMEALQALCQLGTSAAPADRVDSYADQLLLLAPGAASALTAKGNIALIVGDATKAEAFADQVLAQDPQNLPALTLKMHIMIARNKFTDAAALVEKMPDGSINMVSKLRLLQQIDERALNRPSYEVTVRRLAQLAPDDPDIQLDYADMLYQSGQNDLARGAIHGVLAIHSADFRVAAAALNVWMKAGPQALDTAKMVTEAANLPVSAKACYAQFANEIGRSDIAIAILHGVDRGDPTPDNSNAKAALAYAIGVTGHLSQAMAQLNAILDGAHDPNQPWALLARARLLAASHDYINAVRDARLLVVNDRDNATARLTLVDILRASGSADLSDSALREGLRAIPDSVRLASRLAVVLTAKGNTVGAIEVARNLARVAPMDQRARQLLQTYGGPAVNMVHS